MKMKKIYIAALALAAVLPAAAQDTYESGRLLMDDLNGTARYVGMGGAMEALGADISTIATNPAGIGLFRHSTISASAGLVSQQDVKEFAGKNGTKMSFDQLGFVYSSRVSRRSFVNVGFNFHKSHNFNQILSAANSLRNVSQNMLSWHKADLGDVRYGGYFWDFNKDGQVMGYENETSPFRAQTYSQFDYMNMNALNLDEDEEGYLVNQNAADYYMFDRSHRGWIADYDFNVSGNQSDRFYWGVTVGIRDVKYKGFSIYTERLVNVLNNNTGYDGNEDYVDYMDSRTIEGVGIDVKAGIIFRPIEASPFRIGLYVNSPTWYELTAENSTDFNNDSEYGLEDSWYSDEKYKFRYYTPWKFGASLGHTIGTNVALGLTYEYSDYSSSVNRIITDDSDYYYDSERSYPDAVMKDNTKKSLKAVHLLKAGLEFKPDTDLSLRFGYNYVSSAYEKDGVRDMMLDSPGVSYSSTTDYVNWNDTHRITCGMGYKLNGWNFDVAYQYSSVNGEFHPMQQFEADQNVGVSKVGFKRHQVLFTVGYTF
jgi:hypothetical protein